MSVSRCCVLRCRRPATVVREIGEGRVRRYEVCDDHNTDYFGHGRFLSMQQIQRIRVDLVPTQVRGDTTPSLQARSGVPGTPAQASVKEREVPPRLADTTSASLEQNRQSGESSPVEARRGLAHALAVPYEAQKTGQVRPGLKVHELKTDNRAVCGNSRRQPMDDLGSGTVTCESCARDTGHARRPRPGDRQRVLEDRAKLGVAS